MTTGPARVNGPLWRYANYVIVIFICVHVGLVARAALPLPAKLRGPWPWRMFERRGPWERVLRATGIGTDGTRHEVPLERIFEYARGMTPMRAYHQLEALGDPQSTAAQSAFAAFLARRMAELGVDVAAVELTWIATHLDTGEVREHHMGTFSVGSRP